MFNFFQLKTVVKILRNNCLNSDAIFTINRVIFAVSVLVHIMCTHVTADFGVFVHPFQFLTLGIAVILKGDGVIGQAALT
jgi:hypothetical protein